MPDKKKTSKKTFGQALAEVKKEIYKGLEFDKRGILLSLLLLCVASNFVLIGAIESQKLQAYQKVLWFYGLPFAILLNLLISLFLKSFKKDKVIIAVLSVVVVVLFIPPFSDLFVNFLTSIGIPAIVAFFIIFGFAFALFAADSSLFAFIFAFFSVVAVTATFFSTNILSFPIAYTFTNIILGAFAAIGLLRYFSVRAFQLFIRAQKFSQKIEQEEKAYAEYSRKRSECYNTMISLKSKKEFLTVGLAGRRGMGKTTILHTVFKKLFHSPDKIQTERDLKNKFLLKAARIRDIALFVPTPTEFDEKSFLMALLERLAQKTSTYLNVILPSVKPHEVEQELREKRRLLSYGHLIVLTLIIGLIFLNLATLSKSGKAPGFAKAIIQTDNLQPDFTDTKLYNNMRDSLLIELKNQAKPYSSLWKIYELLNPWFRDGESSWNLKGEFTYGPDSEFKIYATWDSLKNVTDWPQTDTLQQTYNFYQSILDSIKLTTQHLYDIRDSVKLFTQLPGKGEIQTSEWFWFNVILFPLVIVAVYLTSREGEQRFTKKVYSNVRNEIALYERTQSLLERLHFQMSYGTTFDKGFQFSRSGFSFRKKVSQKTQREMRPYTTISLIDEYRKYVSDIKMYLNDALKSDEEEKPERVKIHIAIDELDKILNTEKLHNMLKSMKAIFEIEDVYYYLSISEDALETYRLRHVETKNEIDSAFTHIIPIPPMDAMGSLAFFIEHNTGWSPVLLPAAIVLGGGVPRDMHRISQTLGTYPEEITLKECVEKLSEEDIAACADMLLMHQYLSDEGKQFWQGILQKTKFVSKSQAKNLLGKVDQASLDEFEAINPCSGEIAKEQFHRLRSILRGMAVKGYVYSLVRSISIPDVLKSWPEKENLDQFMKSLDDNHPVTEWLSQLEPLRHAIFELSRNPKMVWEFLNNQNQQNG